MPRSSGRLRYTLASFEEMADWGARFRLAALKLRAHLRPGDSAPVGLRMKELGGERLYLRPGTPDMSTIILDYVKGIHLPPPGIVDQDLRQVCEFGSQVGTGLAGLAARYPRARVLGVEPDPENAALARRNIEAFGPRCGVVQAAIWDKEEELIVEGEWESGYTVRPAHPDDPRVRRVQGTTIDSLLDEYMPEGEIDYLGMTVERTERRVLTAGGDWPSRVRSIRCKFYPGKGLEGEEAAELLEDLGFDAWCPSTGFAFGIRRGDRRLRQATRRFTGIPARAGTS